MPEANEDNILVNGLAFSQDNFAMLIESKEKLNANILACNSKRIFKGDAFNIACGDSVSNNKILSFLKEKYPHITVKESPARIGDIMHSKASIEKAKKELGYYPSVYFWDGLKQTLDWWGL
jgi:UDP-N-acetylglucosamine 4-epimerase